MRPRSIGIGLKIGLSAQSRALEGTSFIQLRYSWRGAEVDGNGKGLRIGSELVQGWSKSLKLRCGMDLEIMLGVCLDILRF